VLLPARRFGKGPQPLVLLHGFTGGGQGFEHLEGLLGADASVLCPDLPGHGEAPTLTGDRALPEPFTATAAAIARTAAKAFGGPVHLAGYSMGARLALAVALEFPKLVRSLVLESGGAGLASPTAREERRSADEELARVLDREGLRAFLARWEKTPVLAGLQLLPAAAQESLRERRLRNEPHALAWALRALGQGAQPSYWHRLGELACPVLVVHGAQDAKFSALADRLCAQIPGARREIIPKAGHTPHLEQPEQYAAAVRRFLAQPQARPRDAAPQA
jgi:2-succinyl-6-hydroxy-2,4-cyclohexadiene-1-carboxylate synthase